MPKSREQDLWLVILSLMSVPGIYLLNTALLQNWSSDWGGETAGILPVESWLQFFMGPDNRQSEKAGLGGPGGLQRAFSNF